MALPAMSVNSNAVLRKKLLCSTRLKLIKECKKCNVASIGSKKEMIERIIITRNKKTLKKSKSKKQFHDKPASKKKIKIKKKVKTKKKMKKKKKKAVKALSAIDVSATNAIKTSQVIATSPDNKDKQKLLEMKQNDKDDEKDDEKTQDKYQSIRQKYIDDMNDIETYGIYGSIEALVDRHSYKIHKNDAADPSGENTKKVMREIRKTLPKNIHISVTGSMFIRFDEENPRFLQCLLTGLDGTPYANGMYLFDIYLPSSYPQNPLYIKHITYGSTSCKANNGPGGFSPNLHRETGKVCLSLLGTWSGPGWKANVSNVYQVMSTLLFMVFGAKHPYYMEPSFGGWEGTALKKKKHIKKVWQYDEEVMYHNIRYAIMKTIKEPYAGFEDVIKTHFKVKGEFISKTMQKWMKHKRLTKKFKQRIKPLFNEFNKLRSGL